ncbi:hypothetical protein ROTAS13_01968 [Roseomonas sp. TAS13]|nr:hypothetical protein ROTAS13_01968 [Roseomonas sp. TAS13]
MKENSPICARLAEMVTAVPLGWPKARTIIQAAADLPSTMMAMVPSTAQGASTSTFGSNSMPTETKNSTAKASRKGSASSVARWESWLSAITMPAKKAPRAKETSKSEAAPAATPSASA